MQSGTEAAYTVTLLRLDFLVCGRFTYRMYIIFMLRSPPRLCKNSPTCFCNVKEQSGCRSGRVKGQERWEMVGSGVEGRRGGGGGAGGGTKLSNCRKEDCVEGT